MGFYIIYDNYIYLFIKNKQKIYGKTKYIQPKGKYFTL
jgi:hypothetical protein